MLLVLMQYDLCIRVAMFLLLVLAIVLALVLYYYVTRSAYQYWKKLKIVDANPTFFFGNVKDFVFGKKHISLVYDDVYKTFPNEPYVGMYELLSPNLLIRDPELAHRVLVKDFHHFRDRGIEIDEENDPLTAHLVNLAGTRWKATRAKLAPAFSASKLKLMYPLIEDCVRELEDHLETVVETGRSTDVREAMAKFSTDVIGRCAFGLDFNTLRDPNSQFRKIGKKMFVFSYRFVLRICVRLINPKLLKWIRIKTVDRDVERFFFDLLRYATECRRRDETQRFDFLQLMANIQEQEKNSNFDESNPFTDTLFVANMFVFYGGGFETTSSTLSSCLYELALNPEVQDKLRGEIRAKYETSGGEFSYDMLYDLPYLDMTISETLRKYAPLSLVTRVCNENYNIPGTTKVLQKGTRITVPLLSLHYDPNYFPNPQKFEPERFTDDNKTATMMQSYMPFGDGPRICIGLRFAKLEIKCCLARLLLTYSFSPCDQTEIPLKIKPRSIFFTPMNGIMLHVSKLNEMR